MTSDDILRLPSIAPAAKIAYGAAPQQFAELRLPEGRGPFPVVVVIHGGCWVQYGDAKYTNHIASALTKEGWATWNLEYRRAHEEGGGWPGTFEDVVSGVAALRGAAAKYPLDLARVVVSGHSAGGQLALYAAAKKPVPLRGVVSLAGIADMKAYADGGLSDCAAGEFRVMGGRPDQYPDRYAQVSPIDLLPLHVPQALVWGEVDTIVPERLFESYEKRAQASGDSVEIVRVKNAGHHELCSAEQPGWKQIVDVMRRMLH